MSSEIEFKSIEEILKQLPQKEFEKVYKVLYGGGVQ